ncbi:MAG: tetratricopeptide repeat protein [Acidobacteriota bacterium]
MRKRVSLLVLFCVLAGLETAYFARQCAASLLRLRGERAFFANDHLRAWEAYGDALSLGARRDLVEIDQVELLLFGLDQVEAGIEIELPMQPSESLAVARRIIERRLRRSPSSAYYWSLASDIYRHAAERRRRTQSVDLAALSEDPLENLLREDWKSLAVMEAGAGLEPNNYIYYDSLVESYLDLGSPQRAVRFCERAVAAYPVLNEHRYLLRPDLDPALLDAAVRGFETALERPSMIRGAAIRVDLGRLLARHGEHERALRHLEGALEEAPDLYEAHVQLGYSTFRLGRYEEALAHLGNASRLKPDEPWPRYYMGLSYLELGNREGALEQLRKAREKGRREIRFIHKLAETLERSGNLAEARRQMVAAANINPDDVGEWLALLAFHVRHRQFDAAAEVCARLSALHPGDPAYGPQCSYLQEEGR